MVGDPREAILARLVVIAEGLGVLVLRNVLAVPDDALPAIAILDGDEVAFDGDAPGPGRPQPNTRFSRITMSPEFVIKVSDDPETVGPALNALRQSLIKAVLGDSELPTLTTNAGHVRYVGASSALAYGRAMTGEAALSFAITYLLRPDLIS